MRLLLLVSAFLTALVGIGTPAAAAARPACETSATVLAGTERVRTVAGVVTAARLSRATIVDIGLIEVHQVGTTSPRLYLSRLRL